MTAQIQKAGLLSGRQMTFLLVVGLHALAITALIVARGVVPLVDPEPRITTTFPEDDSLPVPPEPRLVDQQLSPALLQPVVLPVPPEFTILAEDNPQPAEVLATVPAETGAGAVIGVPRGIADDALPTHVLPAIVATDLRYQMTRSSDEYYPEASIRAEERGVAIVRVCVDGAGRMQGAPIIQESSGYRRLDQAAVRWARESLRFTPATVDGVGVPACKGFRVNFSLR